VEIRPIRYSEILGAPNAGELFAEYAAECALPELGPVSPQAALYEAMEKGGGMQAFGVYEGRLLAGFATPLVYTVPHYGKVVASTESLFVAAAHRRGGTGFKLLDVIEGYARGRKCAASFYSAPSNSRFARLMYLSGEEYRHSNSVFVKRLA
jgi:GNAT superfamily N-acetyltransferase